MDRALRLPTPLNIKMLIRKSLYSQSLLLLLKLENKKVQYSQFHFIHLLALVRLLRFWFMFNSYLIERLHKYGCDVTWTSDKIPRIYEEILAYRFNNFVCMIGLCTIIIKFVQIPWPDVHINNLEECFYHVLTNFILLHKNTRLLKKCE